MSPDQMVVFVTVGKQSEAETIARQLVDHFLAACVGILQQASIYRWKGKVTEDKEYLLVIKTTKKRFAALREKVLALHSYEVPEIIGVDIKRGYSAYLDWISKSVMQDGSTEN